MPNSFISNTYVSDPLIKLKDDVVPVPIGTAAYFENNPLKLHVNYSVGLDIDNPEPYEIFLSEKSSDSHLNNQIIDLTNQPESQISLIHNSTSQLYSVQGFFEVEISGLDNRRLYTFIVELKSSNKVIDTKSTSILVTINGDNKWLHL